MAIRLAVVLLTVATLHLGREILVPFALSVLLSFVLAPLATRFERFGLPKVASVLVVVGLCFAGIGGVGYVVTNEVLELAGNLPEHRENLKKRLRLVRGTSGGALERAAEMVNELQAEIEQEEIEEAQGIPAPPDELGRPAPPPSFDQRTSESLERIEGTLSGAKEALPVRIVEPARSKLSLLPNLLGPLIGPVGTAAIVIVLVTFFLLDRRNLRDRIIRLVGETRLDLTTQAVNDAGSRISRYLLEQLALSACFGVPVTLGLWWIGVPGAVLWGALALLLRFLPYIGPWLSALMPVLLSLAVFEGWARPLAVVGLFAGLELFSNNVLEPWLYGTSTGMSDVAVILAAVFWGWLWGPIGVLLSVPLTVCVVVLGKYSPRLEIFSILLGRDPALDPATSFYQRVLAEDDDEAGSIAGEHCKKQGLRALYDDLLLPALLRVERDRHAGRFDAERAGAFVEQLRLVVEEAGAWSEPDESSAALPGPVPILCLAARDAADELAADMLAHLLRSEGWRARALPATSRSGELIAAVRELEPQVVCISCVPPGAIAQARHLCTRLAQSFPALEIVVGLWSWSGEGTRATARLQSAGAAGVVTDFAHCLELVRTVAPAAQPEPPPPAR